MSSSTLPPRQRSLDDLGTALHEVTFCVVDVETTGGPANGGGLTEIGAVKLRGGECLGTFSTLVNPGSAIPPHITVLTGITEAMVLPAPRDHEVLPTFLEFLGDAVVVGHNVRYDLSFLDAALERSGRPRLANRSVDTCALARRLVRDEVRNCKLSTLARAFRLPHQPRHRALDDALATGDLLHLLLERAAGLGVLGLDDLLSLPTIAGHPQAAKLRLTEHLPRRPGVYLFRDRGGRVLYVGKATDLRSRVRSYFSGDDRRKVGALLREVDRIDHQVCATPLEAAVREMRLIHEHEPRFNREGRTWPRSVYVRLTAERFPRLTVARRLHLDGTLHLGPFASTRSARAVVDAVHTVLPLRRCNGRPGSRDGRCASAQIGASLCPCAGDLSEVQYAGVVARLRRALGGEAGILLDPLAERMAILAAQERYEEAADVRDRAQALTAALVRHHRLTSLRRAGRLVVELPGQGGVELQAGRMVRAWGPDGQVPLDDDTLDGTSGARGRADGDGADDGRAGGGATALGVDEVALPPDRQEADELRVVAAFLDRHAHRIRLEVAEHGLALPWPALPSFTPAPGPAHR